jgi:hypothetical protein
VSATLNYWGQSTCTAIGAQIYDGSDLPGRGKLGYAPSLYAPVALAQLATPANLALTVIDGASVTLTWSPIPDLPNVGCRQPGSTAPDLGYRLYYDTHGDCTYDEGGLPAGSSPIDAGQNTTLTLTGLSTANSYYFVVAAYDYLRRESPFSNQVVRAGGVQERRIYLPALLRNR